MTKSGSAYVISQNDLSDVVNADAIFAIVNGQPPDEGIAIELGIAIALGKKTFLFRDDFRSCCESNEYPLNLMFFAGLPKKGWENFYYTSMEDITDPERPLVKWARYKLEETETNAKNHLPKRTQKG